VDVGAAVVSAVGDEGDEADPVRALWSGLGVSEDPLPAVQLLTMINRAAASTPTTPTVSRFRRTTLWTGSSGLMAYLYSNEPRW
jgi:hypothetical protein